MNTVCFRTKDMPDVLAVAADISAGMVMLKGKRLTLGEANPGIPFTGRVYGTLFNYSNALEEAMPVLQGPPYNGAPQEAVFYFKPANTLTGYGETIPVPVGIDALRIEGAIGVVIGSSASRLTPENALAHVLGYTLVCDVSIPGNDFYRHPLKQRCRDRFCPVGPWVVPAYQLPDLEKLDFRVMVDNEVTQTGSIGCLIRSIPDLLVEMTSFMSLYPGDVVLTGTPGNAPLVRAGQTVRIESAYLGVLENPVAGEGEQ